MVFTVNEAITNLTGPFARELADLEEELLKLRANGIRAHKAQAEVQLKKVKAEKARAKFMGYIYIPWLFGRAGSALTALGDYDRLSNESRRKLGELQAGLSHLERQAKDGNWSPEVLEQEAKALAASIGMDTVQADLARVQQPYVNAFAGGNT